MTSYLLDAFFVEEVDPAVKRTSKRIEQVSRGLSVTGSPVVSEPTAVWLVSEVRGGSQPARDIALAVLGCYEVLAAQAIAMREYGALRAAETEASVLRKQAASLREQFRACSELRRFMATLSSKVAPLSMSTRGEV